MSIPAGFTSGGLPVGIQLMAGRLRDDRALVGRKLRRPFVGIVLERILRDPGRQISGLKVGPGLLFSVEFSVQ